MAGRNRLSVELGSVPIWTQMCVREAVLPFVRGFAEEQGYRIVGGRVRGFDVEPASIYGRVFLRSGFRVKVLTVKVVGSVLGSGHVVTVIENGRRVLTKFAWNHEGGRAGSDV